MNVCGSVGSGGTNHDRLKDLKRLFVLKPDVTSQSITEILTVRFIIFG